MNGYTIERGDVLMSVQLAVGRDSQRPESTNRAAADAWKPVPWQDPQATVSELPRRSAAPAPAVVARPAPSQELGLIDVATGAATSVALRRDLQLQLPWPVGAPGPAVVALDLHPLTEIREGDGDEMADRVMRGVIELAPFALRARDRIYRLDGDRLALLLPNCDEEGARAVWSRLDQVVRRVLEERGLPVVAISGRMLDRDAIVRGDSAVSDVASSRTSAL